MSAIQTHRQVLLSAVTATTTSNPASVDNAGRVSLQVLASGIVSGSAVFTVEVSNDGSNWVAYNRLTSNLINTNAQTDTRIASVVINTNSGSMLFVPAGDTFNFIRAIATVNNNVGGTYSAIAFID